MIYWFSSSGQIFHFLTQPCGEIYERLLLLKEVTVIFHSYFDGRFIARSLYKILDRQSRRSLVFHIARCYCVFYAFGEIRYFPNGIMAAAEEVIAIRELKHTVSRKRSPCKVKSYTRSRFCIIITLFSLQMPHSHRAKSLYGKQQALRARAFVFHIITNGRAYNNRSSSSYELNSTKGIQRKLVFKEGPLRAAYQNITKDKCIA